MGQLDGVDTAVTKENKKALSLPLTQLIHENLSIIMTFAYSRASLEELRRTKFRAEWKYLEKSLFSISEERATKACIELAAFIRLLDDTERMSDCLNESGASYGWIKKQGKPDQKLNLRGLTNKIMHAASLEWDFTDPKYPKLHTIPHSGDTWDWDSAEIEIIALAGFCGQLIS